MQLRMLQIDFLKMNDTLSGGKTVHLKVHSGWGIAVLKNVEIREIQICRFLTMSIKKGTAGFVMFFLVIILIRGLRLLSRAGKAL